MGLLFDAIRGTIPKIPPIWLMRQAGRYLPEYRALRSKAGSFLDLCYNPEWAIEVSMQPIRRFDFDAAIIFSDILVIPHALGIGVSFDGGEGPRLEANGFERLLTEPIDWQAFDRHLDSVLAAISGLRSALDSSKDLIGFAGAPFTLLTYLIEGQTSRDFHQTRLFYFHRPRDFKRLITILTQAVERFLLAQVKAGANIVQIFDSWAGAVPAVASDVALYQPHRALRQSLHQIPTIFFPRALSLRLKNYQRRVKAEALGIDQGTSFAHVRALTENPCLQGNIDPMALRAGGAMLNKAIDENLKIMQGRRFIFNLGHGIDKETPIDHVDHLIKRVRSCCY